MTDTPDSRQGTLVSNFTLCNIAKVSWWIIMTTATYSKQDANSIGWDARCFIISFNLLEPYS